MEIIRYGLKDRLDVSIYIDTKFNYSQMREIYRGLRDGLDVSIYANPKFDSNQMEIIRYGLESRYLWCF